MQSMVWISYLVITRTVAQIVISLLMWAYSLNMTDYKLLDIVDASGRPLREQMLVDGFQINTFGKAPEETVKVIRNIPNIPVREDDVFLVTPPKSGTHWNHEVISMLLSGKAENVPIFKIGGMLEVLTADELEKMPSPRVLNCHFPLSMLPRQIKEKRSKIVLVLRNPKDVSVSFYYHHKGMKRTNYEGTFADHHQLFLKGQVEFGDWFDWVLGWEKEIDNGDLNVHLVYFEDLRKNGLEEIRKMAKFLGVPQNEDLFRAIHEKCRFEKLSVEKPYNPERAERVFNPGFKMFRKGDIGDWKNHFTVAMNEEFDALFKEKMKDSKLKFQFE